MAFPYLGGVPIDLVAVLLLAGFVFLIVALRFAGRRFGRMVVKVLWVFKNYTAMRMDAYEDLSGVFIDIIGAKKKEVETISKVGRPIEVEEIDEKHMKAYLLKKPKKGEKPLVHIMVKQGRIGSSREFVTVEGTGTTLDFVKEADSMGTKPGNAPVIAEEQSAAKTFLKLVMAAAESFGNKLLMIGSGVGMGMGLTIFLLLLFGHLK